MADNRSVAILRGLAKPVRYLTLLAGALPALAFPDANLEILAWFGLVPGLLLMRAAPSAREAAVRGWWFGAGFLMANLYWLAPELGPGLLLIAIVAGVLWTGVAVAAWALLRRPVSVLRALAALVVLPSYWLVIEWIRSWQALGGPWAVLGASQWQHPAVLALAAVGGVWLVSFAIVAVNTGIVILVVSGSAALRILGAVAIAIVAAAGPVAFALTPAAPVTRQVTIALVQPGLQQDPAFRANASQRLTAAASRSGSPRGVRPGLIVWGESSVAHNLHYDPALLHQIQALAAASHADILVNQDSIHADQKSKAAVLVSRDGIAGEYAKTRLVPFGEYIPFRQQLSWLTKISKAAPVNMVPGNGAHNLVARLPDGSPLTIGVLICFESAFPDMARVDTDHGAQVIIYQTSDSTFQDTWALAQHASLGALRAAETGRPVVQAALTGDSAAFDGRGRLLSWYGPGREGIDVVRLALPPAAARTPYDRLGDYVPWTAVGIALVAAVIALIRSDHRGNPLRILWRGNQRGTSSVSPSADSPGSGVMAGRNQDDAVSS
jgi:apolipoprotein N-acyltransferase